jgi:serine/threonine protein kinase
VKLLDFGLAKPLEGETANEGDASQSPALSRRMTEAGTIMETAGHMSPEQAREKAVVKRAGIWAFGVALYEMLTGRRLFGGPTVSDTLAAVLRQEIQRPWSQASFTARGSWQSFDPHPGRTATYRQAARVVPDGATRPPISVLDVSR